VSENTKDIGFLYLSQQDVRDTGVDMRLALEAVEDAFKLHHRGEVLLPHKTVLDMDERKRGRGNAMPAYVGGDYHTFGIKWIAGFPGNPARFGLPRGTGLTILNDAESGLPLAVMDCTLLSAMRTGAVTGVGARALARPDSAIVAMIGAGVQARTQLEALKAVLPALKEVRAYDVRREAAEAFARQAHAHHGLEARAVDSAEEAVRGADVVVTVTVADEPIVKDAWMASGSFFSAVGSYQEEEFEVVRRSDLVVVDGLEHVMHRETPVIALMINKGLIRRERVLELGAILCGEKPGRKDPRQRVFFSPIGMAVEDICLSCKVFRLAEQKGIGTRLALF
jgi:2,3-diaminopropionate biosynthesis protein SbnB